MGRGRVRLTADAQGGGTKALLDHDLLARNAETQVRYRVRRRRTEPCHWGGRTRLGKDRLTAGARGLDSRQEIMNL